MADAVRRTELLKLPSGDEVWVRVSVDPDEMADTGFRDQARKSVASLNETIRGVVRSVSAAVEEHRPTETRVEFGVEFTAKASGVVAVLGELGATTSLKVTLTWAHRDSGAADGAGAVAAAA